MEDENCAKRVWNGYTREESMKKMKKCLTRVEKKNGEAAIILFCWIFHEKSIGDKLRSQNLVLKFILKGSTG